MIGAIFATTAILAFPALTSGEVELVTEGYKFTEGPVWTPAGELLFTDIPNDIIVRGDHETFRQPSGKANGLTYDPEGRLIACEHWNRRVTRTERDGTVTVLADSFDGKKLNSPNDAVVRSDGAVFFTDPPYGLEGRDKEQPHQGVYRIDPGGKVTCLITDFVKPNGIGLSPDEKTLYVADSEAGHIRAFDLAEDGSLSNGRMLYELPTPDGMAVDVDGRVWCTCEDGVRIIGPDGADWGLVEAPQQPANCTFGGPEHRTLFMTCRRAVYKIKTNVAGLPGGRK
jgi:gluconolactonase